MATTAAGKMAPDLDTSVFFNQETWSDVKIIFGAKEDPRAILCHRLILSSKSDYFATLLKPTSAFKEAGQKEIRLEEDDPDALEAMLRYIYNFDYQVLASCVTQTDKAFFHLKVRMCAQKYLVPALVTKALAKFNEVLDAMTDVAEIMAVIKLFTTMTELLETLDPVIEHLVRKNLASLLELDLFPEWIGTQPKLCRLLLRGAATFETLEMHMHAQCLGCSKHSGASDSVCVYCGRRLVSNSGKRLAQVTECWAKKGTGCGQS